MIWKDNYSIGVDVVDKQHQELFKRVNGFLKVVRSEKTMEDKLEEIEKTLSFMGEYVVVHFDSEEVVQQENNYPGYEEHHRIHEEFKAEVQEFIEKFEKDKYNEDLVLEFSGKLLTWLINHVTGDDQEIGKYINKGEE